MKIMLIHRWGSIFHGFNLMMKLLMFMIDYEDDDDDDDDD